MYGLGYQSPTAEEKLVIENTRIEAVIAQYNAPPPLLPSTATNAAAAPAKANSPRTPSSQPRESQDSQDSQHSQNQEDHREIIPPSCGAIGASSSPIDAMHSPPPKKQKSTHVVHQALPNPNAFTPPGSSDLEMTYHVAAEKTIVEETPPGYGSMTNMYSISPVEMVSSPAAMENVEQHEPTTDALKQQIQEDGAALRAFNTRKYLLGRDRIKCFQATVDSRTVKTWDCLCLRTVTLKTYRWCPFFCNMSLCAKVKDGMEHSYDPLPGHARRERGNRGAGRDTQEDEKAGKGAAMGSLYPICTEDMGQREPDSKLCKKQRDHKRRQGVAVLARARSDFNFHGDRSALLHVARERVAAMEVEWNFEQEAEAQRVVAAVARKAELGARLCQEEEDASNNSSKKRKRDEN